LRAFLLTVIAVATLAICAWVRDGGTGVARSAKAGNGGNDRIAAAAPTSTLMQALSLPPARLGSTRLPMAFVANVGQFDCPASFVARRGGMTARIEPGAILLQLEERRGTAAAAAATCPHRRGDEDELLPLGRTPTPDASRPSHGVLVSMVFEGALSTVRLDGEDPLPGRHHYLLTNDRSRWRTDVPGYASVIYRGLYDGIDVRVREGSGLEYDLLLAPGADVEQVVVRCEGIDGLEIDEDGALVMQTALGTIRQALPTTWDLMPDGDRRPLACRYVQLDERRFAFEVPDRSPALAMVIDPGLTWSTFLGGSANDGFGSVAIGADESITVVGSSFSANHPITPGAFQTDYPGGDDLLVTRLDPDRHVTGLLDDPRWGGR
jgi:hypothetical protein